jgi:hypothetical protein
LFDKEFNVCLSDISVQSDYAVIHLKQSKTDPFRNGVDIQLQSKVIGRRFLVTGFCNRLTELKIIDSLSSELLGC